MNFEQFPPYRKRDIFISTPTSCSGHFLFCNFCKTVNLKPKIRDKFTFNSPKVFVIMF